MLQSIHEFTGLQTPHSATNIHTHTLAVMLQSIHQLTGLQTPHSATNIHTHTHTHCDAAEYSQAHRSSDTTLCHQHTHTQAELPTHHQLSVSQSRPRVTRPRQRPRVPRPRQSSRWQGCFSCYPTNSVKALQKVLVHKKTMW